MTETNELVVASPSAAAAPRVPRWLVFGLFFVIFMLCASQAVLVAALHEYRAHLDALDGRVQFALQHLHTAAPPQQSADNEQLAALQGNLEAVQKSVAALQAAPADETLAALKSQVETLAAQVKTKSDTLATDQLWQWQLASTLKNAVDMGRPFEAEIVALQRSVQDDAIQAIIKTVQPLAVTGVRSPLQLHEAFQNIRPDVLADETSQHPQWIQKIMNRMRGLVHVYPVPRADYEGRDNAAILVRVDAHLQAGNIAGALIETSSLPAAQQLILKDWQDHALNTQKVIDLIQRLQTASPLMDKSAGTP